MPINIKTSNNHLNLFLLLTVSLGALVSLLYFSWQGVCAWIILHLLGGFGITVGYHRLFTHKSFKAHRGLEIVLALLGTTALQGGVFEWVSHHRRHHRYVDKEGDVSSPKDKGFFFAHVGWTFTNYPHDFNEAKDIARDRTLMLLSDIRVGIMVQVFLGVFLYYVGGLSVFLWGIFFRLFALSNGTFLVNSVCHMPRFGYRNFDTDDNSRNVKAVGYIALGEGYHNNHHKYPTSARQGLKKAEVDLSYGLIKLLSFLHVVTDIKLPAVARKGATSTSRSIT